MKNPVFGIFHLSWYFTGLLIIQENKENRFHRGRGRGGLPGENYIFVALRKFFIRNARFLLWSSDSDPHNFLPIDPDPVTIKNKHNVNK